MADAELLQIIARLYEAAADPAALNSFADEMQRAFSCEMAMLYVIQGTRQKSTDLLVAATTNFEEWAHPAYTGYYRARDIWSPRVLDFPNGVTHGREVIDASLLTRSQFYNEWCGTAGFCHVLTGKFAAKGGVGMMNMGRPERAPAFDDDDKRRLEILLPHIQRAVDIQQRLSAAEQQQALTQEMLERLDLGIMILGTDARLMFANAVARRVLQAGHDLTVLGPCVRPRLAPQASRFERLVRDAALTSVGQGTHPGGFLALPRADAPPLSLLVSPYPAPQGSPGFPWGSALILFADPDARTQMPERAIAQALGLAPAQARLVAALVAGETMADYAEQAGISMNTAKTQMRQIFLKTGVNRQSDLVRAVAANPLIKLGRDGAADR